VIVNAREKEAIARYLEYLREGRTTRRRLFQRACEEPHKVVIYLDSLPRGAEKRDRLKRRLRTLATTALQSRAQLLSQL
jgi:hypothetical protein